MGPESSSATSSTSTLTSTHSPTGKRSRDPEDEVYLDNLRSHKRFLSEIMASSLNGLTVGDSLPENLMESPARSEGMFYTRDEMSWQYSPMSEDSDDSRFGEAPMNTCLSHSDSMPTSPVSPYRYQRPLNGFCSTSSTSSYPLNGNVSTVSSSQPRQRGSDTEGRFPSSPSDICHSADLRRAALLRSVQMRTQPSGPSPFELPFGSGQENVPNIEVEERPCSFIKSLVDDQEYQIEECSLLGTSDPEFSQEKSCRVRSMTLKGDDSED
ncbi:hypothetical protein Gotri_012185 [Gossypium trilobum]|uniref:Uncharacterized protein n=1 Tax=Gossypium trilobum TaxID=34281 RepID=A0A7J9DPV9_9ROSI|nr:hypothetical protein [Gossypium trilobum]